MKNPSITMRSEARPYRPMTGGEAAVAFVQVPGGVSLGIFFDADPQPDRGAFHA